MLLENVLVKNISHSLLTFSIHENIDPIQTFAPKGQKVIRFRLRELMSEKAFKENRRVTFEEVSVSTGVNRTTLSKMANQRGYNTTTDNLDQLCRFFGCALGELAEYVSMDSETKP